MSVTVKFISGAQFDVDLVAAEGELICTRVRSSSEPRPVFVIEGRPNEIDALADVLRSHAKLARARSARERKERR